MDIDLPEIKELVDELVASKLDLESCNVFEAEHYTFTFTNKGKGKQVDMVSGDDYTSFSKPLIDETMYDDSYQIGSYMSNSGSYQSSDQMQVN